ncbi:hypothetical protein [Thalassospira lucentensis]|uniref:hypothetical protein n=1 Tax=Thalassospira lucentensis TaxID=168935 RepID=UPI0003B3FA1A|nr:hypothetical protein [Thalassospira lucentensis]RCK29470.1 hypothetical protein TH1_05920 [Thalassospira lucentensis MCCC 1A00383 = DSM 14000]
MRGKLFALIVLIGIGTAAYFLLPLTPIPAYFENVTHRIGLLFGSQPDEQEPLPARLENKLSKLGVSAGVPVAVQILTDNGAVALWVHDADRFRPLEIYPFCSDVVRNGDLSAYHGDYRIVAKDILLNRDGHASVMLNRAADGPKTDLALNGGCATEQGIPLESDDLRDIMLMTNAALQNGQAYIPVSIYPTAADQPLPDLKTSGQKQTD